MMRPLDAHALFNNYRQLPRTCCCYICWEPTRHSLFFCSIFFFVKNQIDGMLIFNLCVAVLTLLRGKLQLDQVSLNSWSSGELGRDFTSAPARWWARGMSAPAKSRWLAVTRAAVTGAATGGATGTRNASVGKMAMPRAATAQPSPAPPAPVLASGATSIAHPTSAASKAGAPTAGAAAGAGAGVPIAATAGPLTAALQARGQAPNLQQVVCHTPGLQGARLQVWRPPSCSCTGGGKPSDTGVCACDLSEIAPGLVLSTSQWPRLFSHGITFWLLAPASHPSSADLPSAQWRAFGAAWNSLVADLRAADLLSDGGSSSICDCQQGSWHATWVAHV